MWVTYNTCEIGAGEPVEGAAWFARVDQRTCRRGGWLDDRVADISNAIEPSMLALYAAREVPIEKTTDGLPSWTID